MKEMYWWIKADGSTEQIEHDKFYSLMRGKSHKIVRTFGKSIHLFDSEDGKRLSFICLKKEQLQAILLNAE